MKEYAIIGGGPAGYSAAIYLAKQGHSVMLFEKDKLGGTCLNKGCIPTKSFLHSSEVYYDVVNAGNYGINTDNVTLDFSKVIEKKNNTVEKIRRALELTVKNSGVEIIYAEAQVKDSNTITTLDGKEYKAEKIILAAGAKPKQIKGLEFDGKFILSSDDILELDKLPKRVLIIGSGAIGIEWARIFSNFGVEVIIAEIQEHLIPIADIEVSRRVERIFKQKKIKFYLNDSIEKIENRTVKLKSGEEITPDFILAATGREPVCPECACYKIIGDACGEIQLAHYAINQAKELAFGIPYDKHLIPSVIYGNPEIAWAGLREQDCDDSYTKKMLPVTALGKAWCDDAAEGFIKLIIKENKICGAHIISKEASSLIHILTTAMQNNISADKLKEQCFAHPTYAEGIFDLLMQM